MIRQGWLAIALLVIIEIAVLGLHYYRSVPPTPGEGASPLSPQNDGEKVSVPLSVGKWYWQDDYYECVEYVVGRGDTMWGIAKRYYPDEDPRKVEWMIRRANGLEGPEGPVLRPGQRLWIPDPQVYGVGKMQLAAGE